MATRRRIGQLDQRVRFQRETTVDDGQGGRTSSGWSDIATVPRMWANVEAGSSGEVEDGEQRKANTYAISVTVRNRNDITETMAILWRGRRYNIRTVGPYNHRDEFLHITAEGGVPL